MLYKIVIRDYARLGTAVIARCILFANEDVYFFLEYYNLCVAGWIGLEFILVSI